ncbi:YtxH domain-containing protein [Brevibacterium sp. ZH18]|uniref:YtxH domain-containing protein n=1 Tax=Brevibacterium sp. ZH18 TaxID=2927784 RepID=UPI001F604676|nr:YtxH domain-containing protein [Brevibacterium sp. ZH18]MCI4011740.1 YtxH domain-containing protein [Brevibacterium sp. ZH18]
MKKRLILLAGLGVGFVLGSRTGRQSYEKLKAQAQDLWTDPRVQDTVDKANQTIREKSPVVADAVQTAADKVNAAAGAGSTGTGAAAGTAGTAGAAGAGSAGSASSSGSASGSTGSKKSAATSNKSGDVLSDPERSLDDEGPAGVSDNN